MENEKDVIVLSKKNIKLSIVGGVIVGILTFGVASIARDIVGSMSEKIKTDKQRKQEINDHRDIIFTAIRKMNP